MPPYFSVQVAIPYDSMSSNFVKDIYLQIFEVFPYKSGYWGSEKDLLQEIISWNQSLLEKRFILGLDEHFRNDYKQVLLSSDHYSEIRMYWMYRNNEIQLSIIIPEHDMLTYEGLWRFKKEQFEPIKYLCELLWNKCPTYLIQSYLELGGPRSSTRIFKGEVPSINPICIVQRDVYRKFLNKIKPSIEAVEINNNGIQLINVGQF